MTLEKLRKHCLSYPGATEQIQWGADLVFKVGGRVFAVAPSRIVRPGIRQAHQEGSGQHRVGQSGPESTHGQVEEVRRIMRSLAPVGIAALS